MEETKDLLNNSLNAPVLDANDEIIDMGDDFNFDDYQVVRREFFAHIKEPSITFNECKVYVNTACLNKFPNNDYIRQIYELYNVSYDRMIELDEIDGC